MVLEAMGSWAKKIVCPRLFGRTCSGSYLVNLDHLAPHATIKKEMI
jgi:hypothetical protein